MADHCDIIIIGAGSAGLSAARSASEHGLTFTLLEASHRIGGRAYTEEIAPGQPFDLACHWMHSASLNPFVAIADRLGFTYRRDSGWSRDVHHRGSSLDNAQHEELEAYLDANEEAINEAALAGDSAVSDVIDLDSPWSAYGAYWFSLGTSCDIDQTGARDVAAYNDTDEDWPVVEGYGALVASWAAGTPVTLNAEARRITLTRDGVTVETPRGTVTGRTVLLTVSTNVLASGRIAFDPGLPDWKETAARELPLGVHNRIAMLLKDIPVECREPGHATVLLADNDVPMGINLAPYGYSYAVGVTGGRFGAWLERAGQAASVEFLAEHLKAAWGSRIAECFTDSVIVTAWQGDPWTLGSYSAATPGNAHQRGELARPIDDRIFFAGEATTAEFHATCHGAFLSGRRAVDEIAAALRPGKAHAA